MAKNEDEKIKLKKAKRRKRNKLKKQRRNDISMMGSIYELRLLGIIDHLNEIDYCLRTLLERGHKPKVYIQDDEYDTVCLKSFDDIINYVFEIYMHLSLLDRKNDRIGQLTWCINNAHPKYAEIDDNLSGLFKKVYDILENGLNNSEDIHTKRIIIKDVVNINFEIEIFLKSLIHFISMNSIVEDAPRITFTSEHKLFEEFNDIIK